MPKVKPRLGLLDGCWRICYVSIVESLLEVHCEIPNHIWGWALHEKVR